MMIKEALRWAINRAMYWVPFVLGIFLAISPWTPLRDVERIKGLQETPWTIFFMGIALIGGSIFIFLMQRKLQRITPDDISDEEAQHMLDELKQRMDGE